VDTDSVKVIDVSSNQDAAPHDLLFLRPSPALPLAGRLILLCDLLAQPGSKGVPVC